MTTLPIRPDQARSVLYYTAGTGMLRSDGIAITSTATTVTGGFTVSAGTAMNSGSTSTGGTGSSAYTFGDLVAALKAAGLIPA